MSNDHEKSLFYKHKKKTLVVRYFGFFSTLRSSVLNVFEENLYRTIVDSLSLVTY